MVRAVATLPLLLIVAACAADRPGPSFPTTPPARRSVALSAPAPRPRPGTPRAAPSYGMIAPVSNAGRVWYLAPTPERTEAPIPAPAAPAAQGVEIARLRARADAVSLRCSAAVEVRRSLQRLITALSASRKSRSAADATRVEEDVATYKESCAMSKLPAAAFVLACTGLASCSSIDGQIAKLRSEENEVCSQLNELQTERKSIERLITALQEYQRSSNSRNSEALEKAREQYEVAKR